MTSPKTVVNESDTVARPPAQKRLVKIAALDYPKGQMHLSLLMTQSVSNFATKLVAWQFL